ncbi:MAG: TetR/AcrR family transcriptional regulator [Candidatus Metalachnospira sp.]|nr:TetR/AcrR family transcriptional regulator [Candidatus Metalachnospira sp.]
MEDNKEQVNLHDQLILAGIEELNQYGIHSFSVRRIANKCGVSCAAPYKHFSDKQNFIAEIIMYINAKWYERQKLIIEKYPSLIRKQIVEICLEYIRFLLENSQFRSIIMLKYDEFDKKYSSLRNKLSICSYELVSKYAKEVNMPPEIKLRKTFIIRSILYGAALMFDNGELEYTEENMKMVAYSIEREFDLP